MERIRGKLNLHKSIGALALLAWAVLYDLWSASSDSIHYFDDGDSYHASRQLGQVTEESIDDRSSPPDLFVVCDCMAGFHSETWSLQRKYATCPPFNPQTPTLVLEGYKTWGRTGNHLRSFLQAVQYARDTNMQLGIMHNSWAWGSC